jgi:hypothetical protein
MGIMAFRQGQVIHVRIEITIALGTAVLRIGNHNVLRSARERVSQVVQRSRADTQPIGAVLAVRTGPPFVVSATRYNFRLG